MNRTTKHAPAKRKPLKNIIGEHNSLLNIPHLQVVLDSLPYLSAILNEERQAVYVNKNILNFLGLSSIDEVLGERPGEMFGCIHSKEETGGCGTSEYCRYCGAVNSIMKAQLSNSKIIDECRISSMIGGKNINFDLQIIATPAVFAGNNYTILTLNDISSQKRKEVLEKVFFHDILNLSHNLQGFIEIVQESDDPVEIKTFLDQISNMVLQMNDEILSQRELLAAESGDLAVTPVVFKINEYLPEVIRAVAHHNCAIGKEIILAGDIIETEIETDKVLLTRVIVNMIKNACEAEKIGGTVSLESSFKEDYVFFSVKNAAYISDDVKHQIFQRSFSTKGLGRGIGTYSMKLFGGTYLKGEISFNSNKSEGTCFTLKLPCKYPA